MKFMKLTLVKQRQKNVGRLGRQRREGVPSVTYAAYTVTVGFHGSSCERERVQAPEDTGLSGSPEIYYF